MRHATRLDGRIVVRNKCVENVQSDRAVDYTRFAFLVPCGCDILASVILEAIPLVADLRGSKATSSGAARAHLHALAHFTSANCEPWPEH